MRISTITYLVFGVFCILTSCSYKQDQILFQQKKSNQGIIQQENAANITNYRIKPQDILEIKNVQNSKTIVDLTIATGNSAPVGGTSSQADTYLVDDDGNIALTGLGRQHVAGLTRQEATKYVEGLYHDKFLKDPILEVKITNLKVTILGEVKAPGNLPLTKDRTTLIEIIGAAGGFTDKANEKNVEIIRGDKPNSQVIETDLSDLTSLSDPRTILQNNDIIYVRQNKKAVRNDKLQNFSTIMQPALILINTALIIFTLAHN